MVNWDQCVILSLTHIPFLYTSAVFCWLHTSSCGSKTLVNISLFAPDIKSTATPPPASGKINSSTFDWDADGGLNLCVVRLSLCPSTVKETLQSEKHAIGQNVTRFTAKQRKTWGSSCLRALTIRQQQANFARCMSGIKGLSNVKHQLITSSRWLNTSRVDDWRVVQYKTRWIPARCN